MAKKKKKIGPDFCLSWLKFGSQNFFHGFHLVSYHSMQFQENLMNQTWENGKTPGFRPDFGPNLVPKVFFRGFSALLQAIIVCNFKEN